MIQIDRCIRQVHTARDSRAESCKPPPAIKRIAHSLPPPAPTLLLSPTTRLGPLNRPNIPSRDPQLRPTHLADPRHIHWPLSPPLLNPTSTTASLPFLTNPLQNNPILPRLPSSLLLPRGNSLVDALPHTHGHLRLAEDAGLGAEGLDSEVSGLAPDAAFDKGLVVGYGILLGMAG